MENITHSLVGATLAEIALPATATTAQRRIFFTAGIIAANLPDADLFYARITTPPLGYLLHHRGHTHTIGGLVAQALLIGLIALLPPLRRRIGRGAMRFGLLTAAALLSHLVLDSWNSYGVHPFWPFDNRWVYGDAIYIAEPWLWILLGVAAVMNARSLRPRVMIATLLGLLVIAVTWFKFISFIAFASLTLFAVSMALMMTNLPRRARAMAALASAVVFVVAMFGLRHVVGQRAIASIARAPGAQVVDMVLSPEPANPLCWSALSVVKDERAGEYVMTRGSVALVDVARCGAASHGRVVWEEPVRQSLVNLRRTVRDDCRVRAWMQFGRAPAMANAQITDLRFGALGRTNFTTMLPPAPNDACPQHLTAWAFPRADLLE
ncbi:MAG: metal-dependent hydrolase [bacterium]